jgi:hypothetical protein
MGPSPHPLSVGSVGDAYDNALAETTIGLYQSECLRDGSPFRDGPIPPWQAVDERLACLDGDPDLHADLIRADPLHDVEGRPDRAMGIVLMRERIAELRRNGVADEHLDSPAVSARSPRAQARSNGAGAVELFRIGPLGQLRRPDEITEQRLHDPPFWRPQRLIQPRAAPATEQRIPRCPSAAGPGSSPAAPGSRPPITTTRGQRRLCRPEATRKYALIEPSAEALSGPLADLYALTETVANRTRNQEQIRRVHPMGILPRPIAGRSPTSPRFPLAGVSHQSSAHHRYPGTTARQDSRRIALLTLPPGPGSTARR